MNYKKLDKLGIILWLAPMLLGGFITLGVALFAHFQNEHTLQVYSSTLADKTEALIEERFQQFEYGLRATRGAIIAAGVNDITRKQFERYSSSRDIETAFPGALGFGFIRRVPVDQEANFVARAREDGAPNFTIRALTEHDQDRFIIQYIYPFEKNSQALGLDVGSESNRRLAALSAAREDKTYLTQPITLVQANKKARKGALILYPIYSDGIVLNTSDAREEALVGWAYAPLVIDDVLANLGELTDHASIRLTNTKDGEPFYRARDREMLSLNDDKKVVRSIFVLGQQWELELIPTVQSTERIRFWNVGWVVTTGLLLTLFGMLAMNLLRTSHSIKQQEMDIHQVGVKSVRAFLTSTRFNRSWPFTLLILLVVLLIAVWLILQSNVKQVSNELSLVKETTIDKISQEAAEYRRDTLFLANTSPILRIEKQVSTGMQSISRDKVYNEWSERIADIFKAYMLSVPEVHQVRFIEASNGWQERVKVQRTGNELTVSALSALQSKENEPYINATLNIGEGNVYESNINLNREFGRIEQPDRPVWRFSTPLFYEDGSPFGIIIMNVSADQLLTFSSDSMDDTMSLYITNEEGDFLQHPNPSKAFTFEYGYSNRWQDEFQPSSGWMMLERYDLSRYIGQTGDVVVSQGKFWMDIGKEDRALSIYISTPLIALTNTIIFQISGIVMALFLFGLIIISIQYRVWLSEKIRQRDEWNLQIEAQRNKETVRFKALLESAPDATFVIDDVGIIQLINVQAEKLFGYDRLHLEHHPIQKLIPQYFYHVSGISDAAIHDKPDAVLLGAQEEIFALRSDGKEFPVEMSVNTVNLDDRIQMSVSIRDISARLAIEEKLRTALYDAEMATEAKSAFLANTSHEIRTPLNAIIGLGYLLAEENLTTAQLQLVSKIQISGKSLLGIVNNVLDLSKIEANEMELEEQSVELRELFEEVASVFVIQAEGKNLDFELDLSPRLPAWVITDSVRLRQILTNLLSNALKFTNIGKISVSASVLTDSANIDEGSVVVRLMVADTGIGLSQEAQSRLFKPFTQADSSTTRRFGGTGLGLSIVHQLVNLMSGSIYVESAESVGSQFWIDLPFRVQTTEEMAQHENQNQMLFVLIAEDDPVDARVLQQMTRALGWRSEVVSNGAELVKTFLARIDNNLRSPDAIIVDWQMPVMDGMNAIQTLERHIGRDNLPAVLMVSSYDKKSITEGNHADLVNCFLMKPVNASALFNAVNDVVTLNTGNTNRVLQSTNAEAVGAKWLPGIRVLVVDDSSNNLIVVSHILEHNGATVQTSNSGEGALALLQESPDGYDAVLMDVQMPGIDGLETTRRIRNVLGLVALPVIALTAGALLEEKNRALEAGMDDFLTKPIDLSKLINVLRRVVESFRGKEIPIAPADVPLVEHLDWPSIMGLNAAKAKSILMSDKVLFLNTLSTLFLEHGNLLTPPKEDIDAPEFIELRLQLASQVHKLRSVSGMVGAEEIQQISAEAERILRADDESAKDVMIGLSLALHELHQASSQTLEDFKQDKRNIHLAITNEPVRSIDQATMERIVLLLEEQDLDALEAVEEHKVALQQALGDDIFQTFQGFLMKLQYKEAIGVLDPLINSLKNA